VRACALHFLDSEEEAAVGLESGKAPSMTVTIQIAPELEAELARQAAKHGLGIDAYAANLLERRFSEP